MSEPKEYKNYLELLIDLYPEDEFLIADGFDDAVIGVDYGSSRLIYSCKKCIEILIEQEEMTAEDAIEHFQFNVAGAWVGEKTPIWCEDSYEL
jgi:hypothetical protein